MCSSASPMCLKNLASRNFDVEKSETRTLSNILDPARLRTQKFAYADSGESVTSPTLQDLW
jgi:hypothetical protein